MSEQRVLVTGMGGELGTRVAQLIEQRPWAGEVVAKRSGIETWRWKRDLIFMDGK